MIEMFFRSIVTTAIPPDYDVELTFASAASPYFWSPREFNGKVIDSLNAGALFYTYVGARLRRRASTRCAWATSATSCSI